MMFHDDDKEKELGAVSEEVLGEVVDAADQAGLARKVARVVPLICIKG